MKMLNTIIRIILIISLAMLMITPVISQEPEIILSPEDLETFTIEEKKFGGAMAEDGTWLLVASASVEDLIDGTQDLSVKGSFEMLSPGLAFNTNRNAYKGIFILLIGERTYDENGGYSYGRDILGSSYLTDTGLPVEGYERGLPTDIFGGNTRHPINKMITIPTNDINVNLEDGIIRGSFAIDLNINSTEIPPGHYLLSLMPGIQIDDTNFVTLRNDDPSKEEVSRNSRTISSLGLVPTGKPSPPRMPWVILPDHFDGGIVAKEDSNSFVTTNRTGFKPAAIISPIDPDGGQIQYRLEPALPLVSHSYLSPVAFDFESGEISVKIRTPQGQMIDLGTAPVVGLDNNYLATSQERFRFAFSFYGKHEIEVKGFIKDSNGMLINGGGVYVVYVAKPLELRPVIKPGMPVKRNETIDLSMNIIPPLPAKVTVKQIFNPWSRKGDVNRSEFSVICNEFGVYSPKEAILRRRYTMTEKVRFTEPGEYRLDLIAEYRDDKGVLYMGSLTLAGIVFDSMDLVLRGEDPAKRKIFPQGKDVFTVPSGNNQILAFPENPDLVFDPDLRVVLKDELLTLGVLRGEKTQDLPGGEIGVLPRSTALNNPAHFYPERIDRKMYSYISAVAQDGRTLFVIKDGTPMAEEIINYTPELNFIEGDFLNIYGSMLINDSSLRKKDVFFGFVATGAIPSRDIDQPQLVTISDGIIPMFSKNTPFLHSFTFYPGSVIERGRHFIPRFHVFPPLSGMGRATITYPNGEKAFVYMDVDERGFAWTNPDSPPELWQEGNYKAQYTFFPNITDQKLIENTPSGIADIEFPFYVVNNRKESKINWHIMSGSKIEPNRELTLKSVLPQETYVEGSVHIVASFNGNQIWDHEIKFEGDAFEISLPVPRIVENIRSFNHQNSYDVLDFGILVKGVNAKGSLVFKAGRITIKEGRIFY